MRILEISRGVPSEKYPLNGIFEMDQAKSLAAAGHEVVLFGIDLRSVRRKRKFGFSEFYADGVRVLNYSFYLGRAPYFLSDFLRRRIFKKLLKKLKRLEADFVPDIIHAHFCGYFCDLCLWINRKYGYKYVITEHDSRINKDLFPKNRKEKIKDAYNGAHTNIAVSEEFCANLKKLYGTDFHFVPNVADLKTFSFDGDAERQDGKFVCVCSLTENKNVGALIRAIEKLNRYGYNCSLDIVGQGAKENELKELAANLGIYEKVVFHGVKTRGYINNLFRVSSIFALASRSETFGVVYIEAMSAGLPVIATACGGPQGFVTDEVGKLVPVEDDGALFDAMKDVLDNRGRYHGEKIREYCTERFSPESVAKSIIGVIENA